MEEFVDHHSFLVEHNLLTDEMKDNVSMAGYCIVEHVKEVETIIDFNSRTIQYHLLLPNVLCKNLKLLDKFRNGENIGLWNSIRLKKFLKNKREAEIINDFEIAGYELEEIANKFVKNYLNNKWSASVKIYNADNKDEIENFRICGPTD